MKFTRQQLKEHIREMVRKHLEEQMIRPRSSRISCLDSETDDSSEDESVVFMNTEPKSKSRQKELADLWSQEQQNSSD